MKPFFVALVGMKHRGTEALVRSLPDGENVTLIREHGNRYDPRAIQVWARGVHIGYIAMKQNAELSAMLDAGGVPATGPGFTDGHSVAGTFKMSAADKWPMIEVAREGWK